MADDHKFATLAPWVEQWAFTYPWQWSKTTASCGHACVISAEMKQFLQENPEVQAICLPCLPDYLDDDDDRKVAMLPGQEEQVKKLMGDEKGHQALRIGLAEFEMLGFKPVPFEEMSDDRDDRAD